MFIRSGQFISISPQNPAEESVAERYLNDITERYADARIDRGSPHMVTFPDLQAARAAEKWLSQQG